MAKIKDGVREVKAQLSDQVSKVRTAIEDIKGRAQHEVHERQQDIEDKVQKVLETLKSQEFLKNPGIQDLMKKVKKTLKSRKKNKVRVDASVESSPVKENVVEEPVVASPRSFEETRHAWEDKLKSLTDEISKKIFERAEEVKKSIRGATKKKVKVSASKNSIKSKVAAALEKSKSTKSKLATAMGTKKSVDPKNKSKVGASGRTKPSKKTTTRTVNSKKLK